MEYKIVIPPDMGALDAWSSAPMSGGITITYLAVYIAAM